MSEGLHRCWVCGQEWYNCIPCLGGVYVCLTCDRDFKRVSGKAAGTIIHDELVALRSLEGPDTEK